jgi:hypothetical protein
MEAHHNGDTLIAFMEMVRKHHSPVLPLSAYMTKSLTICA